MSTLNHWPTSISTTNLEEMIHIRRQWLEVYNHERESDWHPLIQGCLELASLRTSKRGCTGYRIKSVAQLTMSIPPDAYDNPEPTDRILRSANQDAASLPSLPDLFTETDDISALLANTSVTEPPEKRENDTYRTPDYTTILYPNEPDRGERLMFIHELKRDTNTSRLDSNFGEDTAFDNMANQTLEQAQLALLNYNYLSSVFIMCHVGGYIKLLKYNRASTPNFGVTVLRHFALAVPVYKSKVCMFLNSDATDFSSEFKKIWTTIKNKVSQDLDAPIAATRLRVRQQTIGVTQQDGGEDQKNGNEDGKNVEHAHDHHGNEEGERDEWGEWSEDEDEDEDEDEGEEDESEEDENEENEEDKGKENEKDKGEGNEEDEKAIAIDGSGQQGSRREGDHEPR